MRLKEKNNFPIGCKSINNIIDKIINIDESSLRESV